MNNNIVLGIDIGGSHITASLVDLQEHAIIRSSLIRRTVNAKDGADKVIKEWAGAITECKGHHPAATNKIGIAMPGPFDYENGISLITGLDKYESLYGLNVKEMLAAELGIHQDDILLMNDATCFLKGEVFGGAVKDRNNVIGITLGTGVGSATYKDGVVYDGDLYITPYKNGTPENYLTTRWFIQRYKEITGITARDVKEIRDKIPGDENALDVFNEFGNNLGEVLLAYIKKHDAENVVIGGNITKAWDLIIPATESLLLKNGIDVSIVRATLGEEAALLGAGSLFATKTN